jgi:aminopeptidase C
MGTNIESIKRHLINIEQFYSDTSLNFSREWDKKEKRDKFVEDVLKATDVEELGRLLL